MSSILKLFHKKWKCPQKDKEGLETFAFTDFLKEYLNPELHPDDTIPDFVTNLEKIKEIIAKLTCPSIQTDKKIGELIKQMVGVIRYYNEEKNKHLFDDKLEQDREERDKVFEEINKYKDFNDFTSVPAITFFSDKEKAQKKIDDIKKGIQEKIQQKKFEEINVDQIMKDAKEHNRTISENIKQGKYLKIKF